MTGDEPLRKPDQVCPRVCGFADERNGLVDRSVTVEEHRGSLYRREPNLGPP